ncbi:MAG: porin family protein [Nitrospira sp.]|nr:porin family protein [Nitrospira sp.]
MNTTPIMATGLFLFCLEIALCATTPSSTAETYVAGAAGGNFSGRLIDIRGVQGHAGLMPREPRFDLADSVTYGGKAGYFPGHRWFGIEGEVLHSTPHIKSLDNDPGIHLRVTSVLVNFVARYPGHTVQPYIGAGVGIFIAHIGDTATIRSDTSVTNGWDLLAGIRAFLTPQTALFAEYKYIGARPSFGQAFGADGGFSGGYRAQYLLFGLSYHF